MARGLRSAALVVLAAACAADPTLAPDSVTDGLGEVLFPTDPSIVRELRCGAADPELIAQALTCTAMLHGEDLTIDVTIDETGAADAVVRERLMDLDAVAEELADRVSADLGVRPEVTCPARFVVDRAGVGFECTATHDDRPLTFRVEIVDDDSTWTVTFDP